MLHRCIRLRKCLQKYYGPHCEVQSKKAQVLPDYSSLRLFLNVNNTNCSIKRSFHYSHYVYMSQGCLHNTLFKDHLSTVHFRLVVTVTYVSPVYELVEGVCIGLTAYFPTLTPSLTPSLPPSLPPSLTHQSRSAVSAGGRLAAALIS